MKTKKTKGFILKITFSVLMLALGLVQIFFGPFRGIGFGVALLVIAGAYFVLIFIFDLDKE